MVPQTIDGGSRPLPAIFFQPTQTPEHRCSYQKSWSSWIKPSPLSEPRYAVGFIFGIQNKVYQMSRHTTLEQYLARRRAKNGTGVVPSASFKSFGGRGQLMVEEHALRAREIWQTNFWNSKQQCLEELRKIKDNIASEEMYIVKWLENYENNVFIMIDQEYQKIKQEVINFLDSGHAENRKRIKDNFRNYGGKQLAEIDNIRMRLGGVRMRIEQLEQELENNASYKKGIIDVVGSDWEVERDQILSKLSEALGRYEQTVYLKVDASRFNRIKEDSANLFFVEAQQGGFAPRGVSFGGLGSGLGAANNVRMSRTMGSGLVGAVPQIGMGVPNSFSQGANSLFQTGGIGSRGLPRDHGFCGSLCSGCRCCGRPQTPPTFGGGQVLNPNFASMQVAGHY